MLPRMGASAEFLNVDLDLWSSVAPAELEAALGPKLFLLSSDVSRGTTRATFEVTTARARTAEATLREFLRVFEAMAPAARRIFRRAERRVLDIGIRAGTSGRPFLLALAPELVGAVARWNVELAVTVYDADPAATEVASASKRTRRGPAVPKTR